MQPEAHVSEDISPHVKRQGGKDDEPTSKSDRPARSRCPTSTAGSGCPKPCDLGRGGGTLLMSTPTMATENQVLEWRPDSPPTGPPHCPEPLLCALLLPSLRGGPALPSPPPHGGPGGQLVHREWRGDSLSPSKGLHLYIQNWRRLTISAGRSRCVQPRVVQTTPLLCRVHGFLYYLNYTANLTHTAAARTGLGMNTKTPSPRATPGGAEGGHADPAPAVLRSVWGTKRDPARGLLYCTPSSLLKFKNSFSSSRTSASTSLFWSLFSCWSFYVVRFM